MGFLGKAELEQLLPAEEAAFPSPVPTQVVWFIPQEQVLQTRDKEGRAGLAGDRFAPPKQDYERNGAGRSNLRYRYVRRPA